MALVARAAALVLGANALVAACHAIYGVSWYEEYGMIATIGSNLFLIFPWYRAHSLAYLQWQIFFSFLASVLLHVVWYTDADPEPFQRLDHGMAVALLGVILLHYLGHLSWPVIFLAVVSSSVPYGNYISSLVAGAYLVVPALASVVRCHMPDLSRNFLFATALQAVATLLFLVDDPVSHASWHVLTFTAVYYTIPDIVQQSP